MMVHRYFLEGLPLQKGPGVIEGALQIYSRPVLITERGWQPDCHPFTGRLAQAQSAEELIAAMTRHLDDPAFQEIILQLCQELVLNGNDLSRVPELSSFHGRAGLRAHPLSRLNLKLTSVESDLSLIEYGLIDAAYPPAFLALEKIRNTGNH